MGFFSWRSIVSGHDIMNEYGGDDMYDGIAILLPDNTIIKGEYDGYGRISGECIYGIMAKVLFPEQIKRLDEEWAKNWEDGENDSSFECRDTDDDRDIIFNTEGAFDQANKMIKVMLRSEVKEGMKYDDYKPSKNAEGQGHWISSYETRVEQPIED
tara:strand:+ start:22 stop:489 length:468 start_codon:yes stop_codon:yes gene_type:complete